MTSSNNEYSLIWTSKNNKINNDNTVSMSTNANID